MVAKPFCPVMTVCSEVQWGCCIVRPFIPQSNSEFKRTGHSTGTRSQARFFLFQKRCMDYTIKNRLPGPEGSGGGDPMLRKRMVERRTWWCAVVVAVVLSGSAAFFPLPAASASDAQDAAQLVVKANLTFQNFMTARETEGFRNLIADARGVFIAPQVLRGAFIVGASGGSGVFFAKDRAKGTWAGPAFYTIGEASFGLQAGGEASEVILLAMTDRGVTALLGSSVKLGADVGIAVGPVGVGADASTANLSADIISYSRSKGLYGGLSLEGAVIKVRNGLNQGYYKKKVTPTDILVRRTVQNKQASGLRNAITAASKK